MDLKIKQADEALQQAVKQRKRTYYPEYHLAPLAGWMNDPNGLIFYNGIYHAFYQHYPYDTRWGPIYWGHATSPDMVHWQHQPIALAPGDGPDKDGCFSGCAVDDKGILSLLYTGHVWLKDPGDESAIRQVQCLATSTDGINFKKEGIVLAPPEGIMHFRDPRVWFQDGLWWMILGARDEKNNGQIYLYRSRSLRDWKFDRVLTGSDGDIGYMWECPDLFPLGNEYILMFSPQGTQTHRGYGYKNRYQNGYLRGQWHPGGNFKVTYPFVEMDQGHDFYGPQSFMAADGRRVIMAWMEMWDSPMPSKNEGWVGCFTLPRELTATAEGEIRVRPVVELESLRQKVTDIPLITLDNQTQPLAENVRTQEIQLEWDQANSTAERYGIRLGRGCSIWMDNQSRRLVLERLYPDIRLSGYRSIALRDNKTLSLQIFFDHSSAEVFVNQGEATLSSRIYPSVSDRNLTIFADAGKATMTGGKRWILKAS